MGTVCNFTGGRTEKAEASLLQWQRRGLGPLLLEELSKNLAQKTSSPILCLLRICDVEAELETWV